MKLTASTLGEICDDVDGVIQTGPFGSQLHESDYVQSGIPVVMPKNIVDGRVSTEDIAYIPENDAERLERHTLRAGDIVYGRRGDIGRRALIGEREDGWLCGTGCLKVALGETVLNPTYLYYYLGQPLVINWIANQAIGATMPNLNTSILRSVPISYPPLPIQKMIASILSAYDDLIENNTRRIRILEQMAQLLYREWFVNFRFPGHERVRMVDSDAGRIPEGWNLESVGTTSLNFDSKRKPLSSIERSTKKGPYPYYGAAKIFDFIDDYIFDGVYLLVGEDGSVITPDKKPVLQLTDGKFWSNNHTHVLQGKDPISTYYLYLTLADADVSGCVTGAAQPKITQANLNRIAVTVPTTELLKEFNSLATPMFLENALLLRKNRNLGSTRDLLLPKLVSGEISVEQIESEVAAPTV